METNKYILDFQKALISISNKKFIIKKEIIRVEYYTSYQFNNFSDKDHWGLASMPDKIITGAIFKFKYYPNAFFNSVFSCYLTSNSYDLSSIPDNRFKERDIEVAKDAIEFAEYYKWLESLNSSTIQTNPNKKDDLNLSQKILALHYLGLNLDDFDKTKSSKILSKILNQSESNTRKHLNQLYSAKKESEIKSSKNLNILLEVFENEQFNEIQDKIKKDIEKLGVVG